MTNDILGIEAYPRGAQVTLKPDYLHYHYHYLGPSKVISRHFTYSGMRYYMEARDGCRFHVKEWEIAE